MNLINSFIENFKKKETIKEIKNINIYDKTHLPKDGWFQGCFNCGTITKYKIGIYEYETTIYKYIFQIFRCQCCERRHNREEKVFEKFKEECVDYIITNVISKSILV